MKTKHLLLTILTSVLCAAAAHAAEDITLTGSTAGRKILYDRVPQLFDPGYIEIGGTLAALPSVITVTGTMSNAVPSLGSAPVTLRFSMSGSAAGIAALNAGTLLSTRDLATNLVTTTAASIAFSDNWPEANPSPLSQSLFTANTNLCVLPFVFFKNSGPGMAGVTNITKEQAIMLASSSGTVGAFEAMKPDFLGGTTNGGPIYFLGRDNGSGTRITVFKDIGFTGTPRQWGTNAPGVLTNATLCAGLSGSGILAGKDGYDSGGTLCRVAASLNLSTKNIIGYAGEADALSGNGITPAQWLTYEGVPLSHATVASGSYHLWGYYHVFAKAATLTANQQAIFNKLVAEITNPGYQSTNTVFLDTAVALNEMKVKRGVDGGSLTTTPAAGF